MSSRNRIDTLNSTSNKRAAFQKERVQTSFSRAQKKSAPLPPCRAPFLLSSAAPDSWLLLLSLSCRIAMFGTTAADISKTFVAWLLE